MEQQLTAGLAEWQIAEFNERLDVKVNYENDFNDTQMNPDISIGLFRILQESLTNITKHAMAQQVSIKISQQDNIVQLCIADDGIGFDSNMKQADMTDMTFGLIGIKERTSMLQGECEIFSNPGKGTTIKVRIPLD